MKIYKNMLDDIFKDITNQEIYKLILDLGFWCGIVSQSNELFDEYFICYDFGKIKICSNITSDRDYKFDDEIDVASGTYKEIFDFLIDKIK